MNNLLRLSLLCLPLLACGGKAPDQAAQRAANAEHIIPSEQQYTGPVIRSSREESANVQQAIANRSTDYARDNLPAPIFRRDAHAKAHGCVRATFAVEQQLPEGVRNVGVFQSGKRYQAWIRYSSGNGQLQADTTRDARGMAIKLMDVPGDRLLSSQHAAANHIQDFLMINFPLFFLDTLPEYEVFARMQTDGVQMGYFFPGWNPFKWRWRQLWIGLGVLGSRPGERLPLNPLYEHYHSMTPYALGVLPHGDEPRNPVNVMRFAAKPVACANPDEPPAVVGKQGTKGDNYLRQNLNTHMTQAQACFHFNLHLQDPLADMPIEEPTRPWKDARVVHAATITIPAQQFDSELHNDFCEAMSYSPWHGLTAHRPLGAINRIRKAVYEEIALFRHMRNVCPNDDSDCHIYGQPKGRIHQPTGWCVKRNGYGDPVADASCSP